MSGTYRRLALLLAAAAVAASCSDGAVGPVAPGAGGGPAEISDAGHGDLAPGFYFLPPMVEAPEPTGTFDAELSPVVTVCEGEATSCESPVAEFTMISGPGSETVRVVPEDEHYIVSWHTDESELDPSSSYRIAVSVVPAGASEALVLGYADVQVGTTGADLKNVETGEEVPLKDGKTLPIKFRIEEGIAGRLVVDPATAEVKVGDTQAFDATVYDLHGNELTGASVSWSSGDEGVATVNASGEASSVSEGTATIKATSGRASDAAELTVTADGLSPSQVAELLAGDGDGFDQFGYSVAVGNHTAVIGAPGSDDPFSNSGASYVFDVVQGSWTEVAKLTADDGEFGDEFGTSVAVSGDIAVVGAPYYDDNGPSPGSAYVFYGAEGKWTQVAKLTARSGAPGDGFGTSVAVSGDLAMIGAPFSDDLGTNSGSVYVFDRSGGTWTQVAKLTPHDGTAADEFGWSVALSGDLAVVGARGVLDLNAYSGSAYVFERVDGAWNEVSKLEAGDGSFGDGYGHSVALSGSVAMVGAPSSDDLGTNSGAAYVFDGSAGTWMQIAKLTPADGTGGERFGWSVAMSGDVAVVGAYGADDDAGSFTGAAYVFDGAAAWKPVGKLTPGDGDRGDSFGRSVAVSRDLAAIGAPGSDGHTGSSYLFDLP